MRGDGLHSRDVNLENRRHQESPKTDNHPQTTPKNSSDTPTMLSKNAHLAELRLFPFVPINRLQTPTKLVLNCAFQIATNKIFSAWKLRCCLTAACASGTQGLAAPAPCVEEKRCANGGLHSQQAHQVTASAQRAPKMSTD